MQASMKIDRITQQKLPHTVAAKDCPGAMVDSDGTINVDAECFHLVLAKRYQPDAKRARLGTAGTNFKAMCSAIGIDPIKDCGCGAKAEEMDLMGDQWCRDHFEELLAWLLDGEKKYGWGTKVMAWHHLRKLSGQTFFTAASALRWMLEQSIGDSERSTAKNEFPIDPASKPLRSAVE
jgi:hypothetical protein